MVVGSVARFSPRPSRISMALWDRVEFVVGSGSGVREMASPRGGGIEPAANGSKVHRSVQLSYEGRCGPVIRFFTTHPSRMSGSEIQILPRL